MLEQILVLIFIITNPLLAFFGQNLIKDYSLTGSFLKQQATQEIPANKLPLTQNFLASQTSHDFLPIRNWNYEDPKVNLKAGIVFDTEKEKNLWNKNITEVLPIASLTKLMTAIIVSENMKLDRVVNVSQAALDANGNRGGLKLNEKITVFDLLKVLLME